MRFGGYGRGGLADGADAGGMGRGSGLSSGVFRCLGSGGAFGAPVTSRVWTRRLMAAFLTRPPWSDLNKEGSDVSWDNDGVKTEPEGRVSPS